MIPREVVPSVALDDAPPARVAREFEALLAEGVKLVPSGTAKSRPRALLKRYGPRYRLSLFDACYWLSDMRQNEDIRFYVGYVRLGRTRRIHPRIFYKDVSLTWRSASHFARSEGENWIGKGDVTVVRRNGELFEESNEGTTDLPLEIQTALEDLCQATKPIAKDDVAVAMVLRRGPDTRVAPYRDFTGPRERAAADRSNLVNRGRSVARFTRSGDPLSLRFVSGFEPDFRRGVVEEETSTSRLYGGALRRFRIVSKNREAQYLFIAGPRQVWIASCQATTTELMSFGVRTVDVVVDEDLLIPGYEYHFMDDSEDPPELVSQVPDGYAGAVSEVDASRVDTSAWLDRLPVIRRFRRQVLGQR
jgi:hypothetical protein